MTADDSPGHVLRESNPYIGPRPFRQQEAGRFSGRATEAHDVMNSWINERVTVLHGPTAIGKTSLLQAGLLPLLPPHTDISVLDAAAPADPAGFVSTLLSRGQSPGEAASPESAAPRPLLAAIDHFEELSAELPVRHSERAAVIAELATALRTVPTLRLLLVSSDDDPDLLRSYAHEISISPPHYISLGALSWAGALAAITRPLDATGRSFEEGAPEELLEKLSVIQFTDGAGDSAWLRDEKIHPLLLQITCTSIWASLAADTDVITAGHLWASGDVDQALARYYESVIRAVQLETNESEQRLRGWIDSTFITERGTRGTAIRGLSTTAGMPNYVADAFAESRIISAEYRARSTWYQLIHDRLISPIRAADRAWRNNCGLDFSLSPSAATPEEIALAAAAALGSGNFSLARDFATQTIDHYRKMNDNRRLGFALTLQASIASAEKDFEIAEQYLQEALAEFSLLQDQELTARTLSALANVSFAAGDYGKAEELQREAVARLPTYVDAMIGLGYAEWYAGSLADAEATFALALGRNAQAARAAGGRGQVLAELAEYDSALANLDPALDSALPPEEEVDARSARALALTGLGRAEEADRELAFARRQAPDRARTHRRAGAIAALRKQTALAIAEFQLALEAEPPLPPWDKDSARRFLDQLRDSHTLV